MKAYKILETYGDPFFQLIGDMLNHTKELRVKERHEYIKSIARISDNEVFTINDLIQYEDYVLPIKHFILKENDQLIVEAYTDRLNGTIITANINNIKKNSHETK